MSGDLIFLETTIFEMVQLFGMIWFIVIESSIAFTIHFKFLGINKVYLLGWKYICDNFTEAFCRTGTQIIKRIFQTAK